MISAEEAKKQSKINIGGKYLIYVKDEIKIAIKEGKFSITIPEKYVTQTIKSLLVEKGYIVNKPFETNLKTWYVIITWR